MNFAWCLQAEPESEPEPELAVGAPWTGGSRDAIDHGIVFGQHGEFAAQLQQARAGGSTIHIAKSLNGPWEPLISNHLGGCNNPAPWYMSTCPPTPHVAPVCALRCAVFDHPRPRRVAV